MMSQDLQVAFDWNALCAKNAFTVVTEYGCSDVSFMTNLYLVKHFTGNHAVCLVLFNKTLEHYNHIARKFGINLNSLEEKGQLYVVELLKETETIVRQARCERTADLVYEGEGLCRVFEKVKQFVEKIKTKFEHFVLLLDDLSTLLYLGVSTNTVIKLAESCCSLSRSNNGCFVVTVHGDEKETDEEETCLRHHLQQSCDSSIEVAELATGYSKDIHGQLTVKFYDRKGKEDKTIKRHFKLEDKRVLTFAPGMYSGVL